MSRLGFSNEDYFNLLVIYGECDKVIKRACETFRVRYPNRPNPTHDTLTRLIHNCKTHGQFVGKHERIKPVVDNEGNEITVLGYFTAYPENSLTDAERDLGIPEISILRILKKHKFHPYSYRLVQNLRPGDDRKRRDFCEFILIKTQEDEDFLQKLIWTDEAKFHKNGMFNRHNSHYWSDNNPHSVRERQFQGYWSFNIFAAIKNDAVLVVHFYNENLNGERYLDILQNYLHPLNLDWNQLWYQHDGAPPHSTALVNNFLQNHFEDRWIANNGPHQWPPRSPDITPLDFFVWGRIKDVVYATPLTTKEDCQERVRTAFRSLSAQEIRSATHRGLLRRIHKCLEVGGHQFENLL